jgi:hypothetical protein
MSAEKKKQYKSTAVKLCAGGLTLAVAGLVYFYSAPKFYRATAKIKFVKSGWVTTNAAVASFGPDQLPEECRIMYSDKFMDQAVTNLDLNAYWSKQFNRGVPLKTEESRQRLKTMLDIHPAQGAIVIEIQATGDDPPELAKIVNGITRQYQELRHAGRQQASHEGLGMLRAKWQEKAVKVQEAEDELRRMKAEFDQERSNHVGVDPKDLQELQAQRVSLEDEYVKKTNDYARLSEMGKGELKDVLSSMEKGTNTPLTTAMSAVIRAKDALLETQRLHGADSPEAKDIAEAVQKRTARVDELADLIMSEKKIELTPMKANMDLMDAMIENAKHASGDMKHFADQEAAYARKKKEYDALVEERDTLEYQIRRGGIADAILPDYVEAQVVELADPPTKPVSPDGRILIGALAGGGILAGGGLALLVLLAIEPRGVEEKSG